MTDKATYPLLQSLPLQLDDEGRSKLQAIFRGERIYGDDNLLSWALKALLFVGRACDYGKNRALYIHSQSLEGDLQRHAKMGDQFTPNPQFMKRDSLFALKSALQGRQLEDDEETDLIFFPLNTNGSHWSLLVLDVRARKMVHFDSLHDTQHQELAQSTAHMLLHAGLVKRSTFALHLPIVRPQPGEWQCCFYVILFASECLQNGIDAVQRVHFADSAVQELVFLMLKRDDSAKHVAMIKQRLANVFVAQN